VTTRLSIDLLRSARVRRERYVGTWLPEPLLTDPEVDVAQHAETADSLSMAFLVLLESLSPVERAVFLLKEVFDYGHSEIAETLGTTAANSRQLLHRAKEKVAAADKVRLADRSGPKTESRHRDAGASRERRDVAERFAAAFSAGDPRQFASMLAEGVTFVSDGGGKVSAARRPLVGRETVVNFLAGVHRSARATGLAAQASLAPVEVNGEPAVVVRVAGRLDSVYVLSMIDNAIAAISVIRNPDKLTYIERQLSSIM
jgi:RNA polymerase sigma-70 factor (ECF subfamily)